MRRQNTAKQAIWIPGFALAHNGLGNLLADQGKLEDATAEYRKALELDPHSAVAHGDLGDALFQQDKLKEAEAELRRAVGLDPKLAVAHSDLGGTLLQQGKLDDAELELHQAIALDPELAVAHTNLGHVLYFHHAVDEGLRELRLAADLDPGNAVLRGNLGSMLRDAGRREDAVVEYRRAITLDNDQAAYHAMLGSLLFDLGQGDAAKAEFQRTLAIDPKLPGELADAAKTLVELKEKSGSPELVNASLIDACWLLVASAHLQAMPINWRRCGGSMSNCRTSSTAHPTSLLRRSSAPSPDRRGKRTLPTMPCVYLDPRTGHTFPLDQPRWCGPDHVPLLLTSLPGLTRDEIDTTIRSLWRYRASLPLQPNDPITMGEGCTPLIRRNLHGAPALLKCEWFMPTGSFKDRGASVMLSLLRQQGVREVLEDSSGNGGAAVSAYAAAGGMRATIMAPDSTSPAKTVQMRAHGATVELIPGTRQDTADAAVRRSETVFYASHNWHPFFLHGTKTLAYELWEDLAFRAPDNVVTPCGAG
jgi:tetratricopeptide (TPR) repeat protein